MSWAGRWAGSSPSAWRSTIRGSSLIWCSPEPTPAAAVPCSGRKEAQAIDSDPEPSTGDILHELYPPDRQAEGRQFLRRLRRASRGGEIPDDFDVPAATTRTQVAAEDPWLRSDRNYRELADIAAPTLAAAGAADPVVPAVNLRRIAARIPRSRVRRIPRRPRLPLPGAPAVYASCRQVPQFGGKRGQHLDEVGMTRFMSARS